MADHHATRVDFGGERHRATVASAFDMHTGLHFSGNVGLAIHSSDWQSAARQRPTRAMLPADRFRMCSLRQLPGSCTAHRFHAKPVR
jgi:hypothetical protein